jgi:diguanylate cyclase (GGDEF)-like protein
VVIESFQEALEGLRGRFVRGAAERLERIEALLDRLDADPADAGALRDLMIQFHGFSGAGSTYGFPRVSAVGSEGERLCDARLKERGTPSVRERQLWRSLLHALRTELEGRPSFEPAPQTTLLPFDILIVGADPKVRAAARDLVAREGMAAREAGSRREAEAQASRRFPDGAIVDVRMPEGSAYELVERLRTLPGGEGLPILMVGGPSKFMNRVDAIHCGADAYFEEPVQGESLVRRLEHLLERGRTEPPRVLSVEDDADQADFLRLVMESAGYRVRICPDPGNLETDLNAFRPDLILLDIHLPGAPSGFALARCIRQQEAHAALPILFLTTKKELSSQIESIRAGGDDYLVKPVAPGLLLSAVAARIERARFLKSLLERDGLTRLLNHTAFLERARALAQEWSRDGKGSLAMVLIDLDDFKSLNDRYGHPVGDSVLCSLAALLRRRLRQSDLLGRLGGDEFAATIENIGEKQALRLLDRLRQDFSATPRIAPDGSRFRATFSAGVAILEPGMDASQWRERADAALYAAKNRGRNRVSAAAVAAGG